MDDSLSPFIHQPLNPEIDEIRLISIQPCSDPSALVECEITHGRLSNGIKFETISYVWGTQEANSKVIINGETFRIRANLDEALKRLRYSAQPRVLWIDAICINQDDSLERNHQVQMMHAIYSEAYQANVWLGPSTQTSPRAFRFVRRMAKHGVQWYEKFGRGSVTDDWKTLKSLCGLEYWRRLVRFHQRLVLYCPRRTTSQLAVPLSATLHCDVHKDGCYDIL